MSEIVVCCGGGTWLQSVFLYILVAPLLVSGAASFCSKHDAKEELGVEEERLNLSELCAQLTTG